VPKSLFVATEANSREKADDKKTAFSFVAAPPWFKKREDKAFY